MASLFEVLSLPALVLALAACGGGGGGGVEPTGPGLGAQVTIPDANLRAHIERKLGKSSGAPIYTSEMARIETLIARSSDIRSLEGLQFATNLIGLHVDFNDISDLTPLSRLPSSCPYKDEPWNRGWVGAGRSLSHTPRRATKNGRSRTIPDGSRPISPSAGASRRPFRRTICRFGADGQGAPAGFPNRSATTGDRGRQTGLGRSRTRRIRLCANTADCT